MLGWWIEVEGQQVEFVGQFEWVEVVGKGVNDFVGEKGVVLVVEVVVGGIVSQVVVLLGDFFKVVVDIVFE